VILNGIAEVATRGDLLDRSILIRVPVIDDKSRRDERSFNAAFEKAQPGILGALCDAISVALGRIDNVTVVNSPRMADFARFVVAAEPGLPWDGGEFMKSYGGNRAGAHELTVESSEIGPLLRQIGDRPGGFKGDMSSLLAMLDGLADDRAKRSKDWPRVPHSVSTKVTKLAPSLRKLGYVVERTGRNGRELILRRDEP
jgi:hypothetical protein